MELCYKFMMNQDYAGPVTWLIVDDCVPNTTNFISYTPREDWRAIRLIPDHQWSEGDNTQAANIQEALNYIKSTLIDLVSAIFIIEDDDYYSPGYLTEMMEQLEGYDLAGELCTIYYNVVARGWFRNMNRFHSSLFQIAFRPSVIDQLEATLKHKYIDIHFCKAVKNKNMFLGDDIAIGIKGLPGRAGIGIGHQDLESYQDDSSGEELKKLIGEDSKYYL